MGLGTRAPPSLQPGMAPRAVEGCPAAGALLSTDVTCSAQMSPAWPRACAAGAPLATTPASVEVLGSSSKRRDTTGTAGFPSGQSYAGNNCRSKPARPVRAHRSSLRPAVTGEGALLVLLARVRNGNGSPACNLPWGSGAGWRLQLP